MGRRGPPPKPTKVKELAGTLKKSRQVAREMAPPAGVPARPEWLDSEAKAEWDRVVPQLAELGILTDVDRAMLADYCAAHSLAVRATKAYQRDGLVVKTPQGPLPHPMIKVAERARAQARLLAAEFGLSAASRTRISTAEKPEENSDEKFLFGGRPRVIQGGAGGGGSNSG